MNLKSKIFGANDLRSKTVEVKEWGVSLSLKTLTVAERVVIGQLAEQYPDAPMSVLIVIAGARDDAGELVFEQSDVDALSKKSGEVVARISREIESLSGMGVFAEAEKKV